MEQLDRIEEKVDRVIADLADLRVHIAETYVTKSSVRWAIGICVTLLGIVGAGVWA